MSVLIRRYQPKSDTKARDIVIGAGAVAMSLMILLVIPGDLASKTHLALHGLCAQRPSHSFGFGGEVLPLDARMTGIYLGAALTIAWTMGAGRLRAIGRPPTPVVLLLVLGVAAMAGDGFVGLLRDMGLPHPYAPSNLVRLATGMGAGIALGAGLCHLLAMTVWARPERRQAAIGSLGELAALGGVMAAVGALVLSGLSVFFAPLAIGLVIAAIVVFATLFLSLVMLATGRAWTVYSPTELRGPLVVAVLLSFVAIGALAMARLMVEGTGLIPRFT
jgi:uncharacterized membrane protein